MISVDYHVHSIGLMTPNVAALETFYRTALGFSSMTEPGRLTIGAQTITLHLATGRPYPHPCASNDPWFQHIAIVTNNIGAAHAHALAHGATAITRDGPQRLPASSGGVTAWKFRDPAGHPLELLAFPPDTAPPQWRGQAGLFLGIDHVALVVSDTARSIAFYQTLGFTRTGSSVNQGPAQAALDDLTDPTVLVTALSSTTSATPHIELLDYLAPPAASTLRLSPADAAASRIVLVPSGTPTQDPDGHQIVLDIELPLIDR